MGYFETISDVRSGYLLKAPSKKDALNNAMTEGTAAILPGTYNKAIVITKNSLKTLQSYDTLIMQYNSKTGAIKKLWKGYSVTTLNHINAFLQMIGKETINKKEWLAL